MIRFVIFVLSPEPQKPQMKNFTGWTGTDTRTAYIGATEKYQITRIRVLKNSHAGGNLNLLELSVIGEE